MSGTFTIINNIIKKIKICCTCTFYLVSNISKINFNYRNLKVWNGYSNIWNCDFM